MSKIYFQYGCMSSSKSSHLIQTEFDYKRRGMKTLVLKPDYDTRDTKEPKVVSRIGISTDCHLISSNDLEKSKLEVLDLIRNKEYDVIFIDEVQFLLKETIEYLVKLVDRYNPNCSLMFYGLRNSYNGEYFPSVVWLLVNADKLVEIKAMCWCGDAARFNMLIDENGNAVKDINSSNVKLGGDDIYKTVCRKHFNEGKWKP